MNSTSMDTVNSTVALATKSLNFSIQEFEDVPKWTEEEISNLIHLIYRLILIVFGTIGNMLSFYIMRRTSLNELSACFYMSLLAVADTSK